MASQELAPLSTGRLLKMALGALFKQAGEYFYPRSSYLGGLYLAPSAAAVHAEAELGHGLMASVVMPVIQFIMRAFPEAPLVVRERQADSLEVVEDHALPRLVNRPNAFYPGTLLWMVTLIDWALFGESYWRILSQRGGQPGELWWLPPWTMDPRWPSDGSAFLTHYDYRPEMGTAMRLELDEVLHFRHGLDPWNPRHGLPPLRAVLQDIWVDHESSTFVSTILRNMGVPGMILSPKGETQLSVDEVERVKSYIMSRFTGEGRGQPLALGAPTDVQTLSLPPVDLGMSMLRNTAEERVTAALGIPAAVVGFGTGLENSKVGATMHEFVQLAWNNGIVPLQRLLAAELQRVLLPQFETDTERFQVGWDYDEVQALQDDQNELAKRLNMMVLGGWLKVGQAKQIMGFDEEDGDDIYLRPNTHSEVGPDAPEPEPAPVVPAAFPAQPNGNGPAGGAGPRRNGNGRQPVEQRALVKQGTLEEWLGSQIGRRAGRMAQPPRQLLRLAARLWREEQKVIARYTPEIAAILARYGDFVATAAREVIPKQASLADMLQMSVITERTPIAMVRFELAEVFQRLYDDMADLTVKLLQEALDLPATEVEVIQRQLRMEARERVRLLDLEGESRTNILKILEQARTEGWDEDQLAAALREQVPAGRWTTPEIRATIIARSESRYSGNLAVSSMARDLGAKVLILDARLGPTDAECEARNGWIVSPAEAQMLAGIEHPNGTMTSLVLSPSLVAGSS
jgi:HK97 family phage portal protein